MIGMGIDSIVIYCLVQQFILFIFEFINNKLMHLMIKRSVRFGLWNTCVIIVIIRLNYSQNKQWLGNFVTFKQF